MSGGAPPTYVGGTSGDDDLRAISNGGGTVIAGGDGNDILRGGKSADFLVGGAGDDQMYGGASGDQFRFFGDQIDGVDTDRIYDLKFAEGDSLVFGRFAADFFADASGINAFSDGTAAQITTIDGLRNLVNNSNGTITAEQRGSTDVLIVTIHSGEDTQILWLSNMWSAYNTLI